MVDIIARLKEAPEVNGVGNDLSAHFLMPPLNYIFVNNKTIPNHPSVAEPQRLSALTECELTFYANADNTLRFRYFIQVTHGRLIHGLSWIKTDSNVGYRDSDFKPVHNFVRQHFPGLHDPAAPAKYGIWNGHGAKIGVMHNYSVIDGNLTSGLTQERVDQIVGLMREAMKFFNDNQIEINQLIHKNQ